MFWGYKFSFIEKPFTLKSIVLLTTLKYLSVGGLISTRFEPLIVLVVNIFDTSILLLKLASFNILILLSREPMFVKEASETFK